MTAVCLSATEAKRFSRAAPRIRFSTGKLCQLSFTQTMLLASQLLDAAYGALDEAKCVLWFVF